MKGVVKKLFAERGFYFLSAEDQSDHLIFLHFSQVRNRAPEQIRVGDIVEFELGLTKLAARKREMRASSTSRSILAPPYACATSVSMRRHDDRDTPTARRA